MDDRPGGVGAQMVPENQLMQRRQQMRRCAGDVLAIGQVGDQEPMLVVDVNIDRLERQADNLRPRFHKAQGRMGRRGGYVEPVFAPKGPADYRVARRRRPSVSRDCMQVWTDSMGGSDKL